MNVQLSGLHDAPTVPANPLLPASEPTTSSGSGFTRHRQFRRQQQELGFALHPAVLEAFLRTLPSLILDAGGGFGSAGHISGEQFLIYADGPFII